MGMKLILEMYHTDYKKDEQRNNGRKKSGQHKKNYKYLGILEADTVKQTDEKKKYLIRKFHETKDLQKKSHQSNKHLGCPPCKILLTILKMEKGGTYTNLLKDEDIDDNVQNFIKAQFS